jgi:hypothetical protein
MNCAECLRLGVRVDCSAGYARSEITRTVCPEIAAPPLSNAIDISHNIPYIVAADKTERGSHDNWQRRSCRA